MIKTDNNFEVPAEMREMLDRGVNQAREGFEKVMEVAGEAVSTLDQKADSAQAQALELRKKTLSFTEKNVAAAFDLAASMVKAKSLDEIMKLQTEYMTKQFASVQSHIKDAGQAIQEQTKAAASEFAAEAQKMQTKAKEAVEQSVLVAKQAANDAVKAAKPKK